MASTHEIVVLGANFAGTGVSHYLERQIFPVLQRLDASTSYHITLVSPNTHFFFKVGAPRALVSPTSFPPDKIFAPLAEHFKQYGSTFTFVQGKAVGLEPKSRKVLVETPAGQQDFKYDSLFICTGTTSASALWTLHDSHEESAQAFKKLHDALPTTKSVLIAGAGPVGVETAGEIAVNYPNAKVTLVAPGDVLPGLKAGTISKAKSLLKGVKVDVLPNVRVEGTSSVGSSTKVALSDGTSRTVELFIDARGATKINSEYLPKGWLDDKGRVKTADNYFRVKGDDAAGVYVIGDIVSGGDNTAIQLDAQLPVAASSFAVDIASKLGHGTGSSGGLLSWIPFFGSKGVAQKEFKPMKDTIIIPIGPNGGVGQAMGWGLPSFLVKKAKSEKFLVDLVEPSTTGSKYAKA